MSACRGGLLEMNVQGTLLESIEKNVAVLSARTIVDKFACSLGTLKSEEGQPLLERARRV